VFVFFIAAPTFFTSYHYRYTMEIFGKKYFKATLQYASTIPMQIFPGITISLAIWARMPLPYRAKGGGIAWAACGKGNN
jgi:hypothetical protein